MELHLSQSCSELSAYYSALILDILGRRLKDGHRHFGFEYEFMPERVLTTADMARLHQCLPGLGFKPEYNLWLHPTGMQITFEPGGQIEYISTPLRADDHEGFDKSLSLIESTNDALARIADIRYLPQGYMPDRGNVPMLLPMERYVCMHGRMARTGSRGREMMKGTASIHLHVSMANVQELLPLFVRLCKMAQDDDFRMSDDRKHIWKNTDPTRCGNPVFAPQKLRSSEELVEILVGFALDAEDLYHNMPYRFVPSQTDEGFIDHWTTIFTDIRLNFKGPTLELRTLDSLPAEEFSKRWKRFVSSFDDLNPS